jgi:hypothetical protein
MQKVEGSSPFIRFTGIACISRYFCKRSVLGVRGWLGEVWEGVAGGVGGEEFGEVGE